MKFWKAEPQMDADDAEKRKNPQSAFLCVDQRLIWISCLKNA
jgi:hypothetical protein